MITRYFFILGITCLSFAGRAQFNINFSLDGNYWEHTDLYGGQLGIGIDYRINRLGFRFSYGIGYGEYNRFKDIKGVRFGDDKVFVNHQQGDMGSGSFNPGQTSDYARQHQFDLSIFYTLFNFSEKYKLNISAGAFYSRIHHYYIFDVVTFTDFRHVEEGELDLLLISDQRFYTIGQRTEINLEIRGKSLSYTPYIAVGFGPNYTNFGTVGVRIVGALKGWEKE